MPARPRGPRDKATVETAVLIVQRWILARLRNRRFFSLAELNVAARWWRDTTPAWCVSSVTSWREFFDTIDRAALMPLPIEPYQYAEWRRARVAPDYYVEVQGHFYSVPSRMIRQVVEVRPSRPQSRCSIAAAASRATRAQGWSAATPRSPSTCRANTASAGNIGACGTPADPSTLPNPNSTRDNRINPGKGSKARLEPTPL
jgi:transposase